MIFSEGVLGLTKWRAAAVSVPQTKETASSAGNGRARNGLAYSAASRRPAESRDQSESALTTRNHHPRRDGVIDARYQRCAPPLYIEIIEQSFRGGVIIGCPEKIARKICCGPRTLSPSLASSSFFRDRTGPSGVFVWCR